MRCNYDMDFIQNYNEGNLSMEDRTEFENHLNTCESCRKTALKDRMLLKFIKAEIPQGGIPVNTILAGIDADRYNSGKNRYRTKALLYKLFTGLKSAAPVAVAAAVLLLVFINPGLKETLLDRTSGLFNRINNLSSGNLQERKADFFDAHTDNKTDSELVQELNAEGMGVAPWEVVYADNGKVLFRSYASLIGYKNGHIYRVANLVDLNKTNIQGDVITRFSFSPGGRYTVIGNDCYTADFMPKFHDKIYMVDTETGRYFPLADENYANVAEAWSISGSYYVYGKKGGSGIGLFDADKNKLYEIDTKDLKIESLFVSDNGDISAYADSSIYIIDKQDGKIRDKVAVNFKPVYISGKDKTAFFYSNGKLMSFDIRHGDVSAAVEADNIDSRISLHRNRFLSFMIGKNELGILDLKNMNFNRFKLNNLNELDYIPRLNVSPDGDRIYYGEVESYSVDKNGETRLDISAYGLGAIYSGWMDNSTIVSVNLTGNMSKAGEFNIETYDVTTGHKNIIYTSATSSKPEIADRDKAGGDWKETVVTGDCTVKNGPGKDYEDIGSLSYGDTILLKGSYNGWYLAGKSLEDEFWVEGGNIVDYGSDNMAIGIVTADLIKSSNPNFIFKKGNLLWVLKRETERSYVRMIISDVSTSYSGWINNSDFTLELKNIDHNQGFIGKGARIYEEPDEKSKEIWNTYYVDWLFLTDISKEKDGWSYVSSPGPINGWVKTDDIYLNPKDIPGPKDEGAIRQVAESLVKAQFPRDTEKLLKLTSGELKKSIQKGQTPIVEGAEFDKIVSMKVNTVTDEEIFVVARVEYKSGGQLNGVWVYITLNNINGQWLATQMGAEP